MILWVSRQTYKTINPNTVSILERFKIDKEIEDIFQFLIAKSNTNKTYLHIYLFAYSNCRIINTGNTGTVVSNDYKGFIID